MNHERRPIRDEQSQKSLRKKILSGAAAGMIALTSGSDSLSNPTSFSEKNTASSSIEQLLEQKTQKHAGQFENEEGLIVSPRAQAIVDILTSLPKTQTTIPDVLKSAIRKESFDVAKLIGHYGDHACAQTVIDIILKTSPQDLLQDTEYFETRTWGKKILENLLLAVPQSSIDFGLYNRNVIIDSDDPRIRALLDLRELTIDQETFWRASLLIDDIINKRKTSQEVLLIVSNDSLYYAALKKLDSLPNPFGKTDIKEELRLHHETQE